MNKEEEFLKIINSTLEDNSYLGDDCAYLAEENLCVSTVLRVLSTVLSSFFTGILSAGNSFYRGFKIELLTFPVLQNRSFL